MNFEWMKGHGELSALFDSAREAEECALARPAVSAAAARRAMEIIVKALYQEAVNGEDMPVFVDDMTTTWDFRVLVGEAAVIGAIRTLRENGEAAARHGALPEGEAMRSLEALHGLAAWFGVRKGVLREAPPFVPPRPERIREIMERISPDNLGLRLEPYIRLNGDIAWLPELARADVLRLSDLPKTPEALRTEAFFGFLDQFARSRRRRVDEILNLLPLSPATQRDWEQRRQSVPPGYVAEVEAFVDAMNEEQNDKRIRWRRYADILEDRAGWFLQLSNPNVVPASMRSGYVLPEVTVDAKQYIPLESAVEQMLREIAAGSERKGQLMINKGWCRQNLGMDRPVLLPLNNGQPREIRQKYSKNALHIGNKKYFYLIEWDKASLFSIRARSGSVGEELVTLDRMADWGFADPGSPAAERARERARMREAEAAAREAERQRALLAQAASDEVSPKEIRRAIEGMPEYQKNVMLLTRPEWCSAHIGMDEPVLLAEDEWVRLRRRLQSAGKPLTYSVCMVSVGWVSYVIHRMNHDVFDAMLEAFRSLGD